MEKEEREPYVVKTEGWYKLDERASKKIAFTIMGMEAKINVELKFFLNVWISSFDGCFRRI
jgi:hypothetical protein